MPKVSVLVPVYNVEKYLEQCLDSIIGQTLTDIEIICVNDGSTDSSPKILQKYAKKDKRIKIVNKTNGGLPSARNAGIDVAKGEYLSFIDSDDYIQSNMMQTLYKNAKKTKAEIVICGANIFPETPHADGWYYWVLSPERKFYKTGDIDLLFKNHATRPFVWRTFVKKELIDREKFRLNEQISIGEDNAFQLRLYPKAKGISVIPDKLYNYRWYREGSLMNAIVYKNVNKKTISHINMVIHVAEEWLKSGEAKTMGIEFLRWSVEFLYDDFIRLPLENRVEKSKALTELWTKIGYYKYQYEFPQYIRDMFKYFYTVSEEESIAQTVSVVMSADRDYATLEKSIKSILEQSLKNLELIIINNTVSDAGYVILNKYLMKDKRIRLFNNASCHYTEAYNKVINNCVGKYIQFVRPNCWYKDENTVEEWLSKAEENEADICFCNKYVSESAFPIGMDSLSSFSENISNIEYFVNAALFNSLIFNEFIQENEFEFEDYSLESGSVFLANVCLNTDKIAFCDNACMVAERQYEKDWLSTEDCVKVLSSFSERLELASEYECAALHNKVFSLLSGDYYTNILTNNTLPYWMPENERPNGDNSQYEVIEKLVKILDSLNPDMIGDGNNACCLPRLFSKIVNGRHKFAADISDEYCKV